MLPKVRNEFSHSVLKALHVIILRLIILHVITLHRYNIARYNIARYNIAHTPCTPLH